MLQNKFEMPLDLALKPSKIFYAYLAIIFIFSLVSIYISNALPSSYRLILTLFVIFFFLFVLRKHITSNCLNIHLSKANEFKITLNNNECYEVELFGECIVTYFIVWLNFSTTDKEGKNKKLHVLLLKDSVDKDIFRRFRARLRLISLSQKDNDLIEKTVKM